MCGTEGCVELRGFTCGTEGDPTDTVEFDLILSKIRSLTIRFKQYNELSDIFYWLNIKIDEVAPFSFSQPRNKRKEKEEKRRE